MSGDGGWVELTPDFDGAAAKLLTDCPSLGAVDTARAAIAAMRSEPDGEIYGWVEGGELVAVYGLRKRGLSFELVWLAVDPGWRGKRYGRSALVDALRRCGRKPMTVETEEPLKGWFEGIGFRVVGQKPGPDGVMRYRLGWYAPRLPREAGYGVH